MKRWWIILLILLVLGIVGGAAYAGYQGNQVETPAVIEPQTVSVSRGDVIQSVTAPGALVDSQETGLQSRVNGQVEQLLVRPGDRVTAGQTLAVLGSRERFAAAINDARIQVIEATEILAAQQSALPLAEARLALTEALKAYEKARLQRESKQYARASQEIIDINRANLVLAEDAASEAEEQYDRADDRPEDDPVRAAFFSQWAATKQQRDKAQANLNYVLSKPNEAEIAEADTRLALAKAQMEEAQRKVDQIEKDGGPDLILAKARLKTAEIALEDAQADLNSLEVKAPFAGAVTEVGVKIGQNVSEGAALLSLSNPASLEAQVTVVEEDLPVVQPGQAVDLYVDALPDAEVTGKISRIVPKRVSGDRALYTVYITLDQIPPQMVAGMTVDASIVINSRTGVLRLPRANVRARSDGTAMIDVWANGRSEDREVMVGLRGDSFVEIVTGLDEGDHVVAK